MKKQILIFLLCLSFFLSYSPIGYTQEINNEPIEEVDISVPIIPIPTLQEEQIVVTQPKSEESEAFLWEKLMKHTDNNEYISAGLLALYFREAGYKSDALSQYHYLTKDRDHCQEFVQKIDAGLEDGSTRDIFIHECHHKNGGFGLTQVWSIHECESFYDFAQEWGTSIADAEMQCAWSVHMLKTTYPKIWNQLLEVTKPRTAGYLVAIWLDGASDTGQGVISDKAVQLHKKYGTQ